MAKEVKSEAVEEVKEEVKEEKAPVVVRKFEVTFSDNNTYAVNPLEVDGKTCTEVEAFSDIEAVSKLIEKNQVQAQIVQTLTDYNNSLLESILAPFNARIAALEEAAGVAPKAEEPKKEEA